MKLRYIVPVLFVALCVCACFLGTGCLTTTTGSGTNAVVTVNQANLTLDCGVLESVTAGAVSVVVAKEPASVPALKDAAAALGAALNGANTNTTAQVLAALGSNSNPVLNQQVTSLLGTVSALEQQLLAKYGPTVGGQITLAISQAIYGGFVVGLAGQ